MGSRYYAAFQEIASNSQPPSFAPSALSPPAPFVYSPGSSTSPSPMQYATLVFSHRVSSTFNKAEYFLASGADVLYSPTGYAPSAPHKFSILYNLSQYARYDGQFEFYYVADVVDGSNPIVPFTPGLNGAGSNFNHVRCGGGHVTAVCVFRTDPKFPILPLFSRSGCNPRTR